MNADGRELKWESMRRPITSLSGAGPGRASREAAKQLLPLLGALLTFQKTIRGVFDLARITVMNGEYTIEPAAIAESPISDSNPSGAVRSQPAVNPSEGVQAAREVHPASQEIVYALAR
jgi:hypothetical protein